MGKFALFFFAASAFVGSLLQEDLVGPFIEALNSKDQIKIKAFVDAHFGPAPKGVDWSTRLTGFARDAAPLKVIKLAKATPDLQRALIEGKNGRLTLSLMTRDGIVGGVMLNDPESFDAPPAKNYAGWTDLAKLNSDIMKDTGAPGLGIAILRTGAEPEIVVDGVRSLGKSQRVLPADIWHIGSIGKSMTSTLIGTLIEEGKLKWDTTLQEALPGIKMNPGFRGVTLEQIMHHRGGIPRDSTFEQRDVDRICGNETDATRIRARYAADILGRPPIGKPGEKFAYSNAGYALLGFIAERTTGKSYERLMHDRVFGPLGMKSAITGADPVPIDRIHGHAKGVFGLGPQDLGGKLGILIAPAGNTMCSLADLGRFAKAHLAGLKGRKGLLRPDTVNRLHAAIPEEEGGPGYACGWSVGPMLGTASRHGHNGSNGTFMAELAIFPDQELIVISIANFAGGDPSAPLQAVQAVARRFAPNKTQE